RQAPQRPVLALTVELHLASAASEREQLAGGVQRELLDGDEPFDHPRLAGVLRPQAHRAVLAERHQAAVIEERHLAHAALVALEHPVRLSIEKPKADRSIRARRGEHLAVPGDREALHGAGVIAQRALGLTLPAPYAHRAVARTGDEQLAV